MVYIDNNLEEQSVYIPRNDKNGCYVSPYDKGYQDGYSDGIEDCGDCPIQQKEVVLTATTETVRPDQGYAGMDSVFVDARQLALEKYNEGYHEGEDDGADEQKSKLVSTAFTSNGIFTREDGWNEVEVSVGDIPCVLEEKSAIVTANTQTVLPSSGYEGMSEVEIDATDFGYAQYISGWRDGINNQKSKLSGDTFTENGDYLRADGWSAVTVDVRPQLETKNIVLTAATECITKTPDTTYIGFAVPEWARENGINTGIKTDSVTTIRVKYIGRGQQSDRVAGMTQHFDGASWDWRFFDAPGMGKRRYYDCGSKRINDSTTGQSFTEAGVLYDYTMEKDTLYDNINGAVVFELTGATIPTNYNIWVDVGSIWLEELTIEKSEGVVFHGTAYDDGEGTIGLYDSVSDSVFTLYSGSSGTLVTYTAVYDGIGEVCVDATNICQTYYNEGYQNGQAECPAPNIESGVTFPLNSGFTQTTVTPSSGYDGIGDITIYDNGYGQERYDNGYSQGYAQGQADCPSCPEIESGVTYGIGSGFTGATVTPSSGYDGMAEVTITDNGYGQEKYDEGHNDGYNEGFTDGQTDILSGMTSTAFTQNDTYTNTSGWSAVTVNVSCPTPNLEQKSVTLTATTETVTPSQGYDGMDEVSIDASGLCQNYYNSGYTEGEASALSGLTDTTFTRNGEYINPSGWSAVTVDVKVSSRFIKYRTSNGVVADIEDIVNPNNNNIKWFHAKNANGDDCHILANMYLGNYGYIFFDDDIVEVGGLWITSASSLPIVEIIIPDGVEKTSRICCNSSLSALTIPNTVTEIGFNSFGDSYYLSTLTIPNGVQTIGESAFVNCTSLTSITIPDSVSTIGPYAFSNCPFSTITFGSGVTSIGMYSFDARTVNRSSLTKIYAHMSGTTWDLYNHVLNQYDVFRLRQGSGTLYVPNGCAAEYADWLNALPSGWTISDTL